MLSDVDIARALETGELSVTPFSPRQIRAAGVTLHLGAALLRPRPGTVVDVRKGQLPEYDELTMSSETPFQLDPQAFVLGETFERVTVGPGLSFFVEGRSTWARLGLTIVKTAMLVEPGHTDRAITLEIANHGPNPILLYPEMKIARCALYRLETPTSRPYDANGKYREQRGVGRPVFDDEFRKES